MKFTEFAFILLFALLVFTAADENADLRSVLLQLLSDGKSSLHTNVDISEEAPTKPTHDKLSEMSPIIQSEICAALEEGIQHVIEEIVALEETYKTVLHNNEGQTNLPSIQTSGEEGQDDVNCYNVLAETFETATQRLLYLRLKLEHGESFTTDKPSEESKPKDDNQAQTQSDLHRLIVILEALENVREKENQRGHETVNLPQDKEEDLKVLKAVNLYRKFENTMSKMPSEKIRNQELDGDNKKHMAERNWHNVNCARFMKPCLGWYNDCCYSDKFKGLTFRMSCSFYNSKSNIDVDNSGICVPDFEIRI